MWRPIAYVVLFLASAGLVLFLVGGAVSLLSYAPVPEVSALKTQFYQAYPAIGEGLFADVRFYLYALVNTWLLWPLVAIGGLVFLLLSRLIRQGQEQRLLEHIYFLEQNLERVTKLEAKSRQSLEHGHYTLLRAYEEGTDALFYVSPEGTIEHLNKAAAQLLIRWNRQQGQFARRLLKDVVPGYETSALAGVIARAVQRGEAWGGEIELKQLHIWLDVRLFPGGRGTYLILRDISHTYTPENSLKNSQVLLQQLIAGLPYAAAIVDDSWRYLAVSAPWGDIFGLDVQSLPGKGHFDILPEFPQDAEKVQAQAAQGRPLSKGEERVVLKGTEEWLSWRIHPWVNTFSKIGGHLVFVERVTEDKQLSQRLQQLEEQENKLAYNDLLTGLPNRQLFYDRLNMALAMAYRQLGKVGLMFLDLDGFKSVNDKLGHEAGDMLLKAVAQRLQACVRQTDTVSRLGGDEFTVIAHIQDKEDAALIARKIIETVNEPFELGEHKDVHVGTSIGIALYPQDGGVAADLIRKADTAMYAAKNGGKNQACFYDATKDKQSADG
jgi:diguanylate cyclase (GGDEF)-like protein/PAS domain S-box-containing protein